MYSITTKVLPFPCPLNPLTWQAVAREGVKMGQYKTQRPNARQCTLFQRVGSPYILLTNEAVTIHLVGSI